MTANCLFINLKNLPPTFEEGLERSFRPEPRCRVSMCSRPLPTPRASYLRGRTKRERRVKGYFMLDAMIASQPQSGGGRGGTYCGGQGEGAVTLTTVFYIFPPAHRHTQAPPRLRLIFFSEPSQNPALAHWPHKKICLCVPRRGVVGLAVFCNKKN